MPDSDPIDMVNHPPHYRHASGIEAISISRHLSSDLGQAFQYVFRAEHKNGIEDLRKAKWFLNDQIDHSETARTRTHAIAAKGLQRLAAAERAMHGDDFPRARFYEELAELRIVTVAAVLDGMIRRAEEDERARIIAALTIHDDELVRVDLPNESDSNDAR